MNNITHYVLHIKDQFDIVKLFIKTIIMKCSRIKVFYWFDEDLYHTNQNKINRFHCVLITSKILKWMFLNISNCMTLLNILASFIAWEHCITPSWHIQSSVVFVYCVIIKNEVPVGLRFFHQKRHKSTWHQLHKLKC